MFQELYIHDLRRGFIPSSKSCMPNLGDGVNTALILYGINRYVKMA